MNHRINVTLPADMPPELREAMDVAAALSQALVSSIGAFIKLNPEGKVIPAAVYASLRMTRRIVTTSTPSKFYRPTEDEIDALELFVDSATIESTPDGAN